MKILSTNKKRIHKNRVQTTNLAHSVNFLLFSSNLPLIPPTPNTFSLSFQQLNSRFFLQLKRTSDCESM